LRDVALSVHLLGTPRIVRDGEAVPGPRGYKAWALLAYLLLADSQPTRARLVGLLFGEADDPLAALRWNLSALRRLLPDAELGGDPVALRLPPGTLVDVATLMSGAAAGALRLGDMERELLEGMAFGSSPAFEIWLEAERRHLGAAAEAVLREAALARLGEGDAGAAADLAGRLVGMNPFDENFQTLLVRSLAAAGDGIGAARQVARCTELFRRELGIDPSPALAAAARTVTAAPTAAPVGGAAGARAQLEAGEAAIRAGVLDAGLQCLRRAIADARGAGDSRLHAQALVALGYALVHAARGRDEEAAAALHEALAIAGTPAMAASAAAASRELGYVEFLQGRYGRAKEWLRRAAELAGDDAAEQGRIACVLGSVLTDTAEYGAAMQHLGEALALNRAAGDGRQAAYTLSMLGRVHLLRDELDIAKAVLEESLEASHREHWTAFTPWPASLLADVELAHGDVDAAAERYEHSFALGCQLGDPCWEGIAARGLGRVAATRDDPEKALTWFLEARTRTTRLPDAYRWVDGYILDALCDLGVTNDIRETPGWIEELAALAARTGMRELAVRAYLHRGRHGDDSALAAAQVLAAGIENPALAALVPPPEPDVWTVVH
jgi:DNA-binding SARP family transcriptional activator